jgi:hypothetical protein
MKKLLFLLLCLAGTASVSTQAQIKPVTLTEKIVNTEEHLAKEAIDLLVMAGFREQHPEVKNDAWARTENGFLVSYSIDDIHYNIFLNKKGKMTSQIRYYSERHLPSGVLDQVKNLYSCFTVRSVREITTKNATAYLITIQDETSWKVIRVLADEMDVVEDHKKG